MSPCLRVKARGWTLITMMTGIFVGALVLSACVPLYLSAQREAEIGVAQARLREEARDLASRFRADVRQSSRVEVLADGAGLRLSETRPSGGVVTIDYRTQPGRLTRTSHASVAAVPGERDEYAAPLAEVRFGRSGHAVTARLTFRRQVRGRELRLELPCSATPRSAL